MTTGLLLPSVVFLAAFAAFVVSAAAGGGAGLVLLPLLRLIVPIEGVPAALSIGTAASSLSRIALFFVSIRWSVVRGFLPTALPATLVGVWLLTRLEPAYVDFCIACFLLSNIRALFTRKTASDTRAPVSERWVPLLGAAAGVLSGFTGAVGLAFNDVYVRLGLERREIVATRAMNEVTLHLVKLVAYAAAGVLGRASLVAGCLVAAAAVSALFTVRHLLPRIRESTFHRVGAFSIVFAGVAMFAVSGAEIARLQRAWVAVVAGGDERELRLYWRDRLRLAAEKEEHRAPVLERGLRLDQLPASVRAAFRARTHAATFIGAEQVLGDPDGLFEIEYVESGRTRMMEIRERESRLQFPAR